MDILVLGGTRYFGKYLVKDLIRKNHKVTIATRGVSKDDFGNAVERIIIDRTNKESMIKALKNRSFDLVYDNINYCPNDTKKLLDILNTKHYILTSSSAVYDWGQDISEENFNPYSYPIKMGCRDDFSYGEGKRLCESVLFQNYNVNAIAVRFPVVLGKDDYTKRLLSYVENIILKRAMCINNLQAKMSFISAKTAGTFLSYMAEIDYTGAINAASIGSITIEEILSYIENQTETNSIISECGMEGSYNGILDCTLNIDKAKKIGFEFEEIKSYIFDLIDFYTLNIKKSNE